MHSDTRVHTCVHGPLCLGGSESALGSVPNLSPSLPQLFQGWVLGATCPTTGTPAPRLLRQPWGPHRAPAVCPCVPSGPPPQQLEVLGSHQAGGGELSREATDQLVNHRGAAGA